MGLIFSSPQDIRENTGENTGERLKDLATEMTPIIKEIEDRLEKKQQTPMDYGSHHSDRDIDRMMITILGVIKEEGTPVIIAALNEHRDSSLSEEERVYMADIIQKTNSIMNLDGLKPKSSEYMGIHYNNALRLLNRKLSK